MKPRSLRELQRALLLKGFQQHNSHHRQFNLVINGRKTNMRTFTSHGSKEYSKNLMNEIRQQMHLTSKEAEDFFDCSMNGEKYARLMQTRGYA